MSSSEPPAGCPVDHTKWQELSNQGQNKEDQQKPAKLAATTGCPVDSEKWVDHGNNGGEGRPPSADTPQYLDRRREISSIPRSGEAGNWIYPSEAQFYSAMKRKQHSPRGEDMQTVVPIHNAVNEKTWMEILQWEKPYDSSKCGGPKLSKFSGDSSKLTPRARWNMLWGAKRPFDRHDWVIDRCGTKVEYVIDYYTGESDPSDQLRPSFYMDVRPKLNSVEGVKMRVLRALGL